MNSKNLKLDIWNTDFRVIISSYMINKIKTNILKKSGPIQLFKNTKITPTIYYRILKGRGSDIKNYDIITKFLDINKKEFEKNIIGLTYNGSKFTYPYIEHLNPLLFRIICHVIGDGNIASKNTCRWIQHKNNSHWLSELIEKEIGFLPTSTKNANCDMITISAYFLRLVKYMLDIKTEDLKKSNIVEKFISMNKDYKLQFLTSLILDEGYIRWEKARSLILTQNKREFMENLCLLLDSLGYEHSLVKEEIDKNGKVVYRINIYASGVFKYNKDLNNNIDKFGKYAGLWHKQHSLNNYIKIINLNPKHSKKQKDFINNHINKIIKTIGYVDYRILRKDKIMKPFLSKLSKRYLINKFYYKVKNKELIRMENGLYKPANLNSNFFSDKE